MLAELPGLIYEWYILDFVFSLLAAGHAFLHAQPRWGRALSAIQCLGLGLCQPRYRPWVVAGHPATAVGILVIAGLAMAWWMPVVATHGVSRF